MKKLMSLGCLMALVLAGAPAFAAEANGGWFTATLPVNTTPTTVWTSIPASWNATAQSFNDWTNPLTYQATEAVAVETEDATVITSVKFTALDGTEGDPEELSQYTDAKAGLTIVQKGENEFWYYGLVPNGDPAWVPMGTEMTALPTAAVNVRISLLKAATGNYIKYFVNDVLLDAVEATGVASFRTVSYYGNCPQLVSLVGNKYANGASADPEVVDVDPVTGEVPANISYNRTDLASRGIDVDNADAVKAYLTTKQTGTDPVTGNQKNGLYGWMNAELGIADTQKVEVASAAAASGAVALDFGLASGKVEYVVGTGTASESPTIQLDATGDNTGIKTVKVQIKKGDDIYEVAKQDVGVMQAGKTFVEKTTTPAGKKTYDIVAVPWDAFGGKPVTVDNLLNTAELFEGDKLYVQKDEAAVGTYLTYTLNAEGWVKDDDEGIDAAECRLFQGEAIWLEHDLNSRIIFAGAVPTEDTVYEIAETGNAASWTLMANPSIAPFALSGIDGAVKDDMIILEDVADPKRITFDGTVWSYSATEWKEEGDFRYPVTNKTPFNAVPAGIGFWYVRKPNQQAMSIVFPKSAK